MDVFCNPESDVRRFLEAQRVGLPVDREFNRLGPFTGLANVLAEWRCGTMLAQDSYQICIDGALVNMDLDGIAW